MAEIEMNKLKKESNYMALGVAQVVYGPQISALKSTMERFHVPARYYSLLDSVQDDSLCLTCRDGRWITYTYEKGNESNPVSFDNLDEAAFDLMEAMADSANELQQMKIYYRDLIKKGGMSQVASTTLYETILRRMEKITSTVAML